MLYTREHRWSSSRPLGLPSQGRRRRPRCATTNRPLHRMLFSNHQDRPAPGCPCTERNFPRCRRGCGVPWRLRSPRRRPLFPTVASTLSDLGGSQARSCRLPCSMGSRCKRRGYRLPRSGSVVRRTPGSRPQSQDEHPPDRLAAGEPAIDGDVLGAVAESAQNLQPCGVRCGLGRCRLGYRCGSSTLSFSTHLLCVGETIQ